MAMGERGEVVAWMNEREAWRAPRAPAEPNTHALVLASDYAALLAERDALAKDAERYRWLRDYCAVEFSPEEGNGWCYDGDDDITRLDARIDTAIGAQVGEAVSG